MIYKSNCQCGIINKYREHSQISSYTWTHEKKLCNHNLFREKKGPQQVFNSDSCVIFLDSQLLVI